MIQALTEERVEEMFNEQFTGTFRVNEMNESQATITALAASQNLPEITQFIFSMENIKVTNMVPGEKGIVYYIIKQD